MAQLYWLKSKKKSEKYKKWTHSVAQSLCSDLQLHLDSNSKTDDNAVVRSISNIHIFRLLTLKYTLKIKRNLYFLEPELIQDLDFFRDLLVIRRVMLHNLLLSADHILRYKSLKIKRVAEINNILEQIHDISLHSPWDWVHFHEREFDLMVQMAHLAREYRLIFFMKQIREEYLSFCLLLSEKFWNMEHASQTYRQVYDLLIQGNGSQAAQLFLNFFEKNDNRVIFYYQEQ